MPSRCPTPPGTAGRLHKRPEHLIADKGYNYPSCRRLLQKRGIRRTTPEWGDQPERRRRRRGRAPHFDATSYARRNMIERLQFLNVKGVKGAFFLPQKLLILVLFLWVHGGRVSVHAATLA